MKRLINILLLSCKKATELIEKREIITLSTKEKLQLRIHTSMCKACKSYEQQSDIIEKALSDWVRKKENSGDEKVLSNQAKAGLIDKLNSK
jgi:hypothetical protein